MLQTTRAAHRFPVRWIGLFDKKRGWKASSATFFVSYCRSDVARIRPIIKAAKKRGHRFWLDTSDLKPGGRWSGDIVAAIRGCRAVVVFCSAQAFESNDVLREVAMSGQYDKPILPVFLDSQPAPDAFLYYLSIHQSLNVADPDWTDRFYAALDVLSEPPPAPQQAATPELSV